MSFPGDHSACCDSHQRPTDVLKAEHRVIERVLDALERMSESGRIDHDLWLKAIDFLRNFADGCHHAKEEDALFPRLERAGVPRAGGPVGCMLDEHTRGRALIARMVGGLDAAAAGDAGAARAVCEAAAAYIALLREHIWKEDNILFAMADRVLDAGEQGALRDEFDRTERSEANAGRHERYVRVADELVRATAAGQPARSVR
ncbi:MAG: hemerythrin domain-containing protein [Phycisphaerae bacterium]